MQMLLEIIQSLMDFTKSQKSMQTIHLLGRDNSFIIVSCKFKIYIKISSSKPSENLKIRRLFYLGKKSR